MPSVSLATRLHAYYLSIPILRDDVYVKYNVCFYFCLYAIKFVAILIKKKYLLIKL